MRKRNFSNGEYYLISNPNIWNEHTGFFCISSNYILNYDKDFLFDWVNPKTKKRIQKILPKEYVKSNLDNGKSSEYNKYYVRRDYKELGAFRISLRAILDYVQ